MEGSGISIIGWSYWIINGGLGFNYTIGVLMIIFIWQLLLKSNLFFKNVFNNSSRRASSSQSVASPPHLHQSSPIVASFDRNSATNASASASSDHSQLRIANIVPDSDLKNLIDNLDAELQESEKWENVIEKRNDLLSYSAKCCKPKDGPLKYLSVTVFENCSPEALRDFYMDNEYRKMWDKTIINHEQLQVDVGSGTEIGRIIKKFPLLTPREYVMAWRVWEGINQSFYCFSKECEHSSVPRQKKYVRVAFFRSGWRIRKVPGRNACEIKMLHQEDAGLNVEMGKLAFAKGIWSYVCKMDNAFRKYSASNRIQLMSATSALTLIQKVPTGLESTDDVTSTSPAEESKESVLPSQVARESRKRKLSRRPSNKFIANGLLLLGGAVCLSRGHSSLGAKVAMAYIVSKFAKHGGSSTQNKTVKLPHCRE